MLPPRIRRLRLPRTALMRGHLIDGEGRCIHYHGPFDIVGNKCATCNQWWACHRCHEEIANHPFGKMLIDAPATLQCGHCGALMSHGHEECPRCGHHFNPGCSLHTLLYYENSV
nr:CHY zinc finger protein [Corynebacterium deserti]